MLALACNGLGTFPHQLVFFAMLCFAPGEPACSQDMGKVRDASVSACAHAVGCHHPNHGPTGYRGPTMARASSPFRFGPASGLHLQLPARIEAATTTCRHFILHELPLQDLLFGMTAPFSNEAIKLSEARKSECAEITQERSRKFEERLC